jgi:bifunctional DNase/RNase
MVRVEIINVVLSEKGFVVILKSTEDNRALPIFIGEQEARSIIIALGNTQPARPLTHDLMKNILTTLECLPMQVIVNDLIDDTFYGKIILKCSDREISIDSRPSDAIALAIRTETPIFVARKVIDEAGIFLEETDTVRVENSADQPASDQLVEPPTLDTLKQQLRDAIHSERYERAAQLRDVISKMGTDN